MGESTDPSEESDESIEVSERSDDQQTGNFGGGNTNISDPAESQGFASQEAANNYNQQQEALAQAVAQGISPTNVGAVGLANTVGLDAFGGIGGAQSNQQTAGFQSNLGDMLGGSMLEIDPVTGVNNFVAPDTVPPLELMQPQRFDPFNMTNQVNQILRDRDARGLYSQVTRDDLGNVTGVFNDAPMFGLSFLPNVTTYTGLDDNPYNEDRSGMDGNDEIVPPITNPLTGTSRCPDGYKFDEDLQACRMENKKSFNNQATPSGELFFRQTALDNAPSNLPGGFDFDAANKRFTQGFAYNPSFYNRPMNTTGFTPFSSFKPFS